MDWLVGTARKGANMPVMMKTKMGTWSWIRLALRTKNVLILMSDTGGGHRASAEAIRDAFQLEYGDEYRIFVKDVWKEYTGWPLNDMEGQYKFMVKHVQLWKFAFHGTSPRWIHSVYLAAIAAFYAKEVEAGLMEYKPDIIISVHPLMQHIPLWVLKWQGLHKKRRLKGLCLALKNLKFASSDCPSALLSAVQFYQRRRGNGPVKKTAKALGESLYDQELKKPIGQLVVICGRNEALAETLRSLEWKIPVKIRGFEKQMEKWMGACDCIITKEKGNVPYVVDSGAGVFTRSPKETARIVAEWFSTKTDDLKRMSENALKFAQPDAVFDIVRDIHELACQRGPLANIPYVLTSSFSSLIY
ncbi:UNVERIFIED_CONTAM: Monogalactosyldiacylglycerol synthase 2, chloroplastic [Sesamum latifolium]|uniref:Monogalactosyldiacylglycerol synthase 2, chloroplastic n=1 Tax=Sesamum latifolium TaxID=2727402 RepID=A0AAW2VE16_9LAMI